MLASPSSHAQKSLKTKQEERVSFSKRLTRNVSMAKEDNYHGGSSVAVPFTWESQPGTPKIKFHENPLPPLTPPPSYFYSTPKSPIKKHSKHNLLDTIFPARAARKLSLPVSPAFSSSSSSSSTSSRSSPPWPVSRSMPSTPKMVSKYGVYSSPRKSFDSRFYQDHDHEHESSSPVSTLCFGIGRGANTRSRSSCYASISNMLLKNV